MSDNDDVVEFIEASKNHKTDERDDKVMSLRDLAEDIFGIQKK